MRLTLANQKSKEFACEHFHYSHSCPLMTVGYNVWNAENEWCGCIIFGVGANSMIGKPYGLLMGEVVELVRVALNGKQESTSMAVGKALKYLK